MQPVLCTGIGEQTRQRETTGPQTEAAGRGNEPPASDTHGARRRALAVTRIGAVGRPRCVQNPVDAVIDSVDVAVLLPPQEPLSGPHGVTAVVCASSRLTVGTGRTGRLGPGSALRCIPPTRRSRAQPTPTARAAIVAPLSATCPDALVARFPPPHRVEISQTLSEVACPHLAPGRGAGEEARREIARRGKSTRTRRAKPSRMRAPPITPSIPMPGPGPVKARELDAAVTTWMRRGVVPLGGGGDGGTVVVEVDRPRHGDDRGDGLPVGAVVVIPDPGTSLLG